MIDDTKQGGARRASLGRGLSALFGEATEDYSATQVEFQVTRWLSLLSSISTIGRESVNVRVSKDY